MAAGIREVDNKAKLILQRALAAHSYYMETRDPELRGLRRPRKPLRKGTQLSRLAKLTQHDIGKSVRVAMRAPNVNCRRYFSSCSKTTIKSCLKTPCLTICATGCAAKFEEAPQHLPPQAAP